ncbi:hypothetical protein HJA_05842 [Hyphomonas jannaschiana VP2]|uniref:Uncharacterized protein n=1 Tax=Hyphomonas jannaschiana VP2 TaxID=1280952 RepID=A0A059FGJ1_9PROT|nr:hypothetical protein HJA_05842 [Hyphomonas jannaschiana VP2]
MAVFASGDTLSAIQSASAFEASGLSAGGVAHAVMTATVAAASPIWNIRVIGMMKASRGQQYYS